MKSLLGSYVGFIFDESEATPHHTGTLIIEPEEITLEIPLLASVTDAYDAWFKDDAAMPTELFFRNDEHNFYITGLRFQTRRVSLTGSHGIGRARVDRVVRTGRSVTSYELMNGLRSDLVGLPGWLGSSSISLGVEPAADGRRIHGVTIQGTSQQPTLIPAIPELALAPHFHFAEDRANNRFEMSQTVSIETTYAKPTEWSTHARLHRAMQDLISIAYWHPCNMEALDVQHQEDPEVTASGLSMGTAWRQMFIPSFGRRTVGEPVKPLPKDKRAIFRFEDVGAEGIAKWWSEYDVLGKAMWVLSASMFRVGGTVEVRLLQVAIALEALGYHLAKSNTERSANFEPTVQRVIDKTDCDLDRKVLKGRTPAQWAADFNKAYKGVKHADNLLPDSLDSHSCATEGEWLARLWLARHLGTAKDKLDERTSTY